MITITITAPVRLQVNDYFLFHCLSQILNDMTGNLDAKKACTGAMKLHKKYLKKV